MTKVLHIFTEEPSAKNVFDSILPKLLPKNVAYRVYSHQGKQDLEQALKTTVPSISKIPGSRILITRDQDNTDCTKVKKNIKNIISKNGPCHCKYYIRIICRELESWFLGDLEAVKSAYPRFKPSQYQGKDKFKNVDEISHPSKYLLKIIPEYAGRDSLPKLEVSESIAKFMDFKRNTSESFNQTLLAIKKLAES